MKDHPSQESYEHAAWFLRCETAAIRAVAAIEAGTHGAFLDTGEPVILFERHVFHRLTGGRFSIDHPDVSNENPGGYGTVAEQHKRLQKAVRLCLAAGFPRDPALKSASWGLFQIMGFNFDAAGYPSLDRFISSMYREVDDHLRAFVMFIHNDARLLDALRAKNWPAFKYVYNGPGPNNYAERIATLYDRLIQGEERA